MAVFKVEVFKSYQQETWGNVYHLAAADLVAANNSLSIIVDAEKAFHMNVVSFVSGRVADLTPGTDAFYTTPLSGTGAAGPGAASVPLWDTVRVDFPVAGGGRPSRKFYRGVLEESLVEYLTVNATKLAAIVLELNEMIVALAAEGTPYVDVDAQLIETAVGWPKVQMRQLHRKRRRAAAPA